VSSCITSDLPCLHSVFCQHLSFSVKNFHSAVWLFYTVVNSSFVFFLVKNISWGTKISLISRPVPRLFILFMGLGESPFCTWPHRPLVDLLHQSRMVKTDERGAVSRTKIGTGNWTTHREHLSVAHGRSQIPLDLTRAEGYNVKRTYLWKGGGHYHCSRRLCLFLSGPLSGSEDGDMVFRNVVFLRSIRRYKLESACSSLSPL
jgi:hypothetical protein